MLKRTKAIETKRPATPKQSLFWDNITIVKAENEDDKRDAKQTHRKT